MWTDTSRSFVRLSITSGTAKCSGVIKGSAGTSKITGTIKLQKKTSSGWSNVKSWTQSSDSSSMTFSKSSSASKGNTYRTLVKVTTITNGK